MVWILQALYAGGDYASFEGIVCAEACLAACKPFVTSWCWHAGLLIERQQLCDCGLMMLLSSAGPVESRHAYLDMSNIEVHASNYTRAGRTCKPAMGFSFAAGTTDGWPFPISPCCTAHEAMAAKLFTRAEFHAVLQAAHAWLSFLTAFCTAQDRTTLC